MFRRESLDREFDEEAQSHLDLAIEDYQSRGYSRPEAERIARAKFGLVASSKDAHRDARGLAWLDALAFDARQAVRAIRHAPSISLTAIVTLTAALVLNVSVFAVMDAVLFRGFPLVKDNDTLLFLQERGPSGACCLSYLDFEDWRAQATSFESMAFIRSGPSTFRDGNGRPVDTRHTALSANTFSLLGVPPLLGRDFTASDERPGAPQVAILSHRFWQSRFDGKADVIGATVYVNEHPTTVIGVMPERFEFPLKVEGGFWMPVVPGPELRRRGLPGGGFGAIGRLRDGVTQAEALAELQTINRRLETDHPDTNRGVVPSAITHATMNSGPDAPMIWGSLWIASCFVLIIACANLANLALVRTVGRWRELATKLALGAGRSRMVRQLAIEHVLLGGIAAIVSWWCTSWTVRTWDAVTASQYQVLDYTVDIRALVYLIVVAAISTLLISLAPIVRVMQVGSTAAMKDHARGGTTSLRGRRFGDALIALQAVLAIVLLSGAGVLVRSLAEIVGADVGVRGPDHVLVGLTRLPSLSHADVDTRWRYLERLQAALRGTPGIEQAALGSSSPVKFAATRYVEIDGRPRLPEDDAIGFVRATPEYFSLLGARMLRGRSFTDDDRSTTAPVAIVNEQAAERYWPGQDPIGKRIRSISPNAPADWRVVVGVVSNMMHNDPLRQTFRPIVYVPFAQEAPALSAYWFARSSAPATRLAAPVREAVEAVDPDVQIASLGTLRASFAFDRDFMDLEHSELGKHAKVAPIFAGIALLLSMIGLIAVIAHSVSQRTKEIGIRMAIGATTTDIRQLILREGLSPVAIGVVAGIGLSLAGNRLLQSQLVGVSPHDPFVMTAAPILLVLVASVASQLPARRAASVDPVVALRND